MEKKNARRALAGALVTAALLGSAAAVTAVTTKQLNANFMGIKLVVDGVPTTPKDPNGNVVEPFACEGTTYLPVRAVAEALGKEVKWDGETKTVYIGQIPNQEDNWMKKLPPYQKDHADVYDGTDHTAHFEVAGVQHKNGFTMLDVSDSGWDHGSPKLLWNTNCLYKTMTFTVGQLSGEDFNTSYDATLEVYLDGEYSTSYELKGDQAPKTITIDLNNAPNVKFEMKYHTYCHYGFYDVSFAE